MARKRVLIVSYYWPPSGGIGVLRWLKMTKYLPLYGWEPVVYAPKDAHYPNIDHSNDKDLSDDLLVIKKKIVEPHSLYKKLLGIKKDANINNVLTVKEKKLGFFHRLSVWVRSNYFIPDARFLWINPSVKELVKLHSKDPFDAIISTGPPHTCTRIGMKLKEKLNIPWIADFRDPWTQVDYFSQLPLTKRAIGIHRKMEKEALEKADKTLIVSPSWKRDLEEIGGKNVIVHYNGFDPEDYKDISPKAASKFTIIHSGVMGHDRNPKVFFEVVKELIDEDAEFKKAIDITLVGQVDYSVAEVYKNLGLEDYVSNKGSVTRSEVLQMISESPVLLLLLNQQDNAQGRIPGKLFEYLAVRKTTFCLGPKNSDVADILTTSKGGITVEYDDHQKIKTTLTALFEKWKNKELDQPIDSDIDQFSHINLTKKIAQYLDQLTD